MNKEDILKILEGAKDKNGDVPMRLVRQAFEKLSEPCEDAVSRADAFNAINDYVNTVGVLDGYTDTQEVLRIVKRLPSAQPEIVYCKDCICGHGEVWLSGNGSADFYGYCGRTQLRVLPYDYCSYAKRRTDEQTD